MNTPEDSAHDVIAILDDVGVDQASFFTIEQAFAMAAFLAATYPERTGRLAVLNVHAALHRTPAYPIGMPSETSKRFFTSMARGWGTGAALEWQAPEHYADERFRNWVLRLERLTYTSEYVLEWLKRISDWDVTGILGSVGAPTLLMAHTDHPWVRIDASAYLAKHLPRATFLERERRASVWWMDDTEWVLDQVESFLTGSTRSETFDDRVLATVMFTDIVGSAEYAARMGDQRWRELLEQHDAVTRREIERFRGRHVKSTGDGVLATFDGPARAIRCARALNDELAPLDIRIRAGLHTGEIELRDGDITGIAVVIGSRVMTHAGAGQVLVSGSIPPLVAGSGIEFSDVGERDLKGVPGSWRLFAVS